MKLMFVADGPRDEATLPGIVAKITECPIEPQFESWAHLHHRGSGKGLDRKVRFARSQAASRRLDGLVAVADRDRDSKQTRLKAMEAGRVALRQNGDLFPFAIGVADPRVDVWILDDPVAVRSGIGLPKDAEIPSVRKTTSPKSAIDSLIDARHGDCKDRERMALLTAISQEFDVRRCNHGSETGFEKFAEDCRLELRELITRDGNNS